MNGLYIDYEFCYGCHTCEMACKTEHGFGMGEWGIQLLQMGPREISPGKWEFTFIPTPTQLCDLCEERVSSGRLPTCVHHCCAKVIEFGPVETLAQKAAKKAKSVVFSIGD